MNRSRIVILFIALVGALSQLPSCGIAECYENTSSIPLAGLYSSSTLSSISIDSITVYGIGAPGDSILLDNESSITQVYMPFRVDNGGVTQYVFHWEQSAISDSIYNDTLTFVYAEIPQFHSFECGAMYYYELEEFSYTQNIIDSVAVTTDMFTNVDVETIEIYLKTSDE
ncbi:MAG: DUF6452 family protein [Bacteroidales bacterium]